MSNPRKRATHEEKQERILQIVECLLRTDSVATIIQMTIREYGIEKRMAFNYLKEAREYLSNLINGEIGSHIGLNLCRANHLYAQSVQQDPDDPRHSRNALEAVKLAHQILTDHAKITLIQKGPLPHETTFDQNPLLARILNHSPES